MGIKTKSLIEVQCDLCGASETVEAERPSARLDQLGYRRVKMVIDAIDPEYTGALAWTSPIQIFCKTCLKKARTTLGLPNAEDAADAELERMKKQIGS
jgi:hypothetical protein